jgi:hypothetical protein
MMPDSFFGARKPAPFFGATGQKTMSAERIIVWRTGGDFDKYCG